MAIFWTAKPAGAVYRYSWSPPLVDGDGLASFTASASGATIDSQEQDGDEAVLYVSGGAAGTTAVFTFTATSTESEEFAETVYLPIRATTLQLSNTARDICDFALRKIVGNGRTATANELDDALERLNDLVALWALGGLDIGLSEPLAAGDTVTISDGFISALKFNLRIACHDHYDAPITTYDASMAQMTKRVLANSLVQFTDLTMPPVLRIRASELTEL